MANRKLTRRQAWRIDKIQEERRKRAQRSGNLGEEALASGELGEEQWGLVTAHYGQQVDIEGEQSSQRCFLRSNIDSLVTGDRVVWCSGEPYGVVVAREPRHSELLRPDPYGKLKPVAANIDLILLVIAPLPIPHANLIDRYLVAAEAVDIEPVLLLNKADLIDPPGREQLDELLQPYRDLGYRVLEASCLMSDGLTPLQELLNGRTSVFVGQSGVGKSSLVNALLPEAQQRVAELSETHQQGVHTTTTAQLFHLDGGGSLIDSPGIREFGLWHMEAETVASGFREFRDLQGLCRFRNCAHADEPGCALKEAAATGSINPARLDSYHQIVASLDELEN